MEFYTETAAAKRVKSPSMSSKFVFRLPANIPGLERYQRGRPSPAP